MAGESDGVLLLAEQDEAEGEDVITEQRGEALTAEVRDVRTCCSVFWRSWFVREAWNLIKLAVPVVISQYSQQTLIFISVMFVGHITGRRLELDAAALALSFAMVTGLTVGCGLATAGDTLCSQAYGFKNYKRVGIILQRGILILLIAIFPIYVVWLNTESILLLLQQSPCVARLTADYIYVMCWALPFMFLFQMIQKYLQGQGIVWVLGVSVVLVNVLNAALHAILIYGAGMGIRGSAIAITISFIVLPLGLIVYIRVRGLHRQTWEGWSWESLKGWKQFMGLAVPGLLMVVCEAWCFEISAVLTGAISEVQLGVNTVLIQLLANTFQIPLGLGIAAGVRVGNELGAGKPLTAKRVSYTAMIISLLNMVIIGAILFFTRHIIARIFTEDKDVIEGTATAMYAGIFVIAFDQLAGVTAGILRGLGRQTVGAVLNFFSYYVVGLPVGISLAFFVNMGTMGIWIGLAIADCLQALTFTVMILFTNWEKESEKAIKNATAMGEAPGDIVQGVGGVGISGEVEEEERRSEDGLSVGSSDGGDDPAVRHLIFNTDFDEQETCIDANEDDFAEDSSTLVINADSADTHLVNGHTTNSRLSAKGSTAAYGKLQISEGNEQIQSSPKHNNKNIIHVHVRRHRSRFLSSLSVLLSWPPRVSPRTKSHMKLLLFRSVFFLIGGVLLVAGGITTQFRPPDSVLNGNYSECSNNEGLLANESVNGTYDDIYGSAQYLL